MTLTELLLVVVLLLGFLALGIWFSNATNNHQKLNEGVEQLVSLLRYSKAIAQQTGKPVIISFPHAAVGDAAESIINTNDVTVIVDLPGVEPMLATVNETIKVVQLSNEAASITFHPDGSFDSMTIIIYSLSDDDQRRATISLNGINGTINQQQQQP
ncbi:MAG: hypothetical protein EBU46_00065 [Nitrosomonadaceae bacterium]|nr:hypothetical protein [Nitrosomonadaceae bacterium]